MLGTRSDLGLSSEAQPNSLESRRIKATPREKWKWIKYHLLREMTYQPGTSPHSGRVPTLSIFTARPPDEAAIFLRSPWATGVF
jgi:hypothetical protein